MPRYDFVCPTCGLKFEVKRPISQAADAVACPVDGAACSRLFSAPAMFAKRGDDFSPSPLPATPGAGFSDHGHGHSHGHGPGQHTH